MNKNFMIWKTGSVTISDVDERGIVENCMVLSADDVRTLFEKIEEKKADQEQMQEWAKENG